LKSFIDLKIKIFIMNKSIRKRKVNFVKIVSKKLVNIFYTLLYYKNVHQISRNSHINNNVKERILEVLKKHNEGLPIVKIAEIIGLHRHTVTKYVYELVGADVIQIREIGSAKVCFLKGGNTWKI
jgi:predicted transcriptional regulator